MVKKIFTFSQFIPFMLKDGKYSNKYPASSILPTHNDTFSGSSLLQRRYMVAFLGFLCGVIMHSHRINISIAMVAMVRSKTINSTMALNETDQCPSGLYSSTETASSRGEFTWSSELQGYILSAGFLGYFFTQIPGGILTKRFGSKKLLVPGLLVASICNLLSPSASRTHPYILLFLTLVRGMAQGMKQPALSVLMSKWFPRSERGFLSSFIYCGYPLGAFITGVGGGKLCDLDFLDGWPLVFYVFGFCGIFVAVLFLVFYHDKPEEDPGISKAELSYIQSTINAVSTIPPIPWMAIFKSVPFYALSLGLFGQYWMAYQLLAVHPIFLVLVLHVPVRQASELISYPHAVQAIVGWLTCYFSFWNSRHGKIRIDTIRKGVNSTSCFVFIIGMVGIILAKCNFPLHDLFMCIAASSVGFGFGGSFITAVDMSPTFAGPLMGCASTLASIGSFLVPVTAGRLTNEKQNLIQWQKIFIITTGVSIASGIIFQFLGSADVQPWDPTYTKPALERKKETDVVPSL